jgi:hypothetical protein
MIHSTILAGLLGLAIWGSVPAPRPPVPVRASNPPGILVPLEGDRAPAAEGRGPLAKAVCLLCLGALLSGGTSVAAVIVTALFNPELAFACGGICLGAF